MKESSGQELGYLDLVLFATKAKDEHGVRSTNKTVLRPSFVVDKDFSDKKTKVTIARVYTNDGEDLILGRFQMDLEKLVKINDELPFTSNRAGKLCHSVWTRMKEGKTWDEAKKSFTCIADLMGL